MNFEQKVKISGQVHFGEIFSNLARGRTINFCPKAVMKFELIESERDSFRRFILRNEIFVGKNQSFLYA